MPVPKSFGAGALVTGALLALASRSVRPPGLPAAELLRTWQGDFAAPEARSLETLTVLDWNIERGLQFDAVRDTIRANDPDICILQEVDFNARRTGNKNIAEELARDFGLNYVFGIEFLEVSQGSASSPAFHGQATLTRLPIADRRILRFTYQSSFWEPRWYLPNWNVFQARQGGRTALVTELEWDGSRLVVYNAHLESRTSTQGRLAQLDEVLADAGRYPPQTPIVLAGDLNTHSQPALLVERLERAAFRNAIENSGATVPAQSSVIRPVWERVLVLLTGAEERGEGRGLDWAFVRGPLQAQQGRVHADVQASDHYPLTVRLSRARDRQATR